MLISDGRTHSELHGSYLSGISTLSSLIGDGMLVLLVAAGGLRGLALQTSGIRLRQVVSWRHTPA